MLQALRVVIDMSRKPTVLDDETMVPQLANSLEKSDVCTLTARTQPEMMEQGHEGASGQEAKK